MSSFPSQSLPSVGIQPQVQLSPLLEAHALPACPSGVNTSYLKEILDEIKEIGAKLRAGAEAGSFSGLLDRLLEFYSYRAVQIRTSVFGWISVCGSRGIQALTKLLAAENPDVVEACALSLGFITRQRLQAGKLSEDEADSVFSALISLVAHDESAVRRAAYRGIRYLGGDRAKQELLAAIPQAPSAADLQSILKELAALRDPELLIPILERLEKTNLYQENGMRIVPSELCLLLTTPFLAEHLDNGAVTALAVRLGFLGERVREALDGPDAEEARGAVEEILDELPAVSGNLLSQYMAANLDERQVLLESWRERVCHFSQVLMPSEERAAVTLEIPASGLSGLDIDLVIAAMRSTEFDSLNEEKPASPFQEQDHRKYRRCYFAPPEQSADWLKTYLRRAEQRFLKGSPLSEVLTPHFDLDLCAAILEEQRTASVEQRAAFASRWSMSTNVLESKEGRLRVKPEFQEPLAGAEWSPVETKSFSPVWHGLNSLWHSSRKELLRYAILDPAGERRVEAAIKGVRSEWQSLSKGARGILKLCAYDCMMREPENGEADWREIFEMVAAGEAAAREKLPSFGIEIQSPNVVREMAHAWKQFLEWSGNPSPERAVFLTTVEAAFAPVWNASSYIPAIKALHRLGFHADYRFHSALHLSVGVPLREEVKYIAIGLRYFRFDEKRPKPAEPTPGQLMLMSKGFVYRNAKCEPVDEGGPLPESRTEIRLAALQNRPESGELHPAFERYVPALQYLSAALLAHQSQPRSRLARVWDEYRNGIMGICTDAAYPAAALLDVDWSERTGEGRDLALFHKLRSIPILKSVAEAFRENPAAFREFRDRVQDAFLKNGEQAQNVIFG